MVSMAVIKWNIIIRDVTAGQEIVVKVEVAT